MEAIENKKVFARDVIVVTAYGQVLPKEILEIPTMAVSMCMPLFFRDTEEQHLFNMPCFAEIKRRALPP